MGYDTILFDMDGVLLTGGATPESVYRRATVATMADFGLESEPPAGLISPDTVDDVRTACERVGLPAPEAWTYRERAATSFENEALGDGERTAAPDASVLSDLAERHTLGVVSNNRHGTVRFAAERFAWPVDVLRGRFPTLAEFGTRKPDPSFIQWSLERTDGDAVLYVGDRGSDVRAARRAGIDAALLSRDGDPPASVDPEYHLESLTELPEIVSHSER